MIPVAKWLRDNRHSAVGDVADEILALLQESREDGIEECARWHAQVAQEIKEAEQTVEEGQGMVRMVALRRAEDHERYASHMRGFKRGDQTSEPEEG